MPSIKSVLCNINLLVLHCFVYNSNLGTSHTHTLNNMEIKLNFVFIMTSSWRRVEEDVTMQCECVWCRLNVKTKSFFFLSDQEKLGENSIKEKSSQVLWHPYNIIWLGISQSLCVAFGRHLINFFTAKNHFPFHKCLYAGEPKHKSSFESRPIYHPKGKFLWKCVSSH